MKPLAVDSLKTSGSRITGFIRHYIIILFLLFLAAIYCFLAYRAYSLEQAAPDQASVSSQLKTAGVPHIDPNAVTKIQQLQDNSVSVQTLFDQARQSPFQE